MGTTSPRQKDRERQRERERENRVGNGFGYFGNQDRLILHSSVLYGVFNTLAYAGWLVSLAGALQFMLIFVYLPVCNSVLLSLHDAQATSPDWGRLVRVFGLIGWPEDCHSTICNPPSVLCCPESIIQPINCVSGYSQGILFSIFKTAEFLHEPFQVYGRHTKKRLVCLNLSGQLKNIQSVTMASWISSTDIPGGP